MAVVHPVPLHVRSARGARDLAIVRVVVALAVGGGGCLDVPPDEGALEPQARVVAVWDPLACGEPHRVAVELEDGDGRRVARSAPCEIGGVTLDVVRWGVYRGRIYAWALGPEIRSIEPVRVEVDAPVVYWQVDTPR